MSDFNTADIQDARGGLGPAENAAICGAPWGGGIKLGGTPDENHVPRQAQYEQHTTG